MQEAAAHRPHKFAYRYTQRGINATQACTHMSHVVDVQGHDFPAHHRERRNDTGLRTLGAQYWRSALRDESEGHRNDEHSSLLHLCRASVLRTPSSSCRTPWAPRSAVCACRIPPWWVPLGRAPLLVWILQRLAHLSCPVRNLILTLISTSAEHTSMYFSPSTASRGPATVCPSHSTRVTGSPAFLPPWSFRHDFEFDVD